MIGVRLIAAAGALLLLAACVLPPSAGRAPGTAASESSSRPKTRAVTDSVFHDIKAAAGSGGRIVPDGLVNVVRGEDQSFSLLPDSGQRVKQIYVDGVAAGNGARYTFREVARNHRIAVLFEPARTPEPAPLAVAPPPAEKTLPRAASRRPASPAEKNLERVADPVRNETAPQVIPTVSLAGLDARAKGLAIARAVRERERGFGNFAAEITMVLRNRNGAEVSRRLRYRAMEMADDGDRSLVVFAEPADLRGTALLTHAHRIGDDDQWLYLPAVARVKRVSTHNKSGSFMGSEFSYEDLASQEVERYTYTWQRDEACGERSCHVIVAVPVDRNSGYARQLRWIETDTLRVRRVDYHDRGDALLKTLALRDYQKHLGRLWRAATLDMRNHQTGKSTTLQWSDYRFNAGLDADSFSTAALGQQR